MFKPKVDLIMDAKINIAKILKDKPQGTKLYSSACGKCELKEADDKSFKVSFYSSKFGFMNGGEGTFDKNGNLYDDGECIIFPSKEMRDWSKFAWKKGDVLVSNDSDRHIIFKGFSKNDYTTFEGKHWISVSKKRHVFCLGMQNVQDYHIEDNKDSAQTYINTIEEKLGGTLNRETLEIEKQYEFKDGDIAFADYGISIDLSSLTLSMGCRTTFFKKDLCKLRLATEKEKKQLFSALEKEGKRWDSDKKAIVDLKPKVELKPFDKVLVRDFGSQAWQVSLFSYKDSDSYYCCNGCGWNQCIPYNEKTAHLLGTTGEWKGGEG